MLYQFIVFSQLSFWSSFHVNLFYQFKIWFSKNGHFKQYFEEVNEFIWEIHKHKSCRTDQDLQFFLVISSSDKVVVYIVHKFMNNAHYHFARRRNDQNKSCRSRKVTQLYSWQLFDLTSFRQGKLCLNF